MELSLFITCFNDTLFPRTGRAVVELLERLGHSERVPEEQTCCGQMHGNSGYAEEATALMRRFVRVFGGCEAIVSPSGSCVAMVRDQYPRLAAGDPGLLAEVRAIGERTWELSELLVDVLGVEDVGAAFPHRVTYHPTCHATRLLGVGDKPLRLLRAVRGIELVELPGAAECCGFGGTFAVKNADVSTAMLSDKLAGIHASRAEVCVAADNSCLMHIGGGLRRERAGVRTMHLAEVLAETGGQGPWSPGGNSPSAPSRGAT